VRLGFSGVGFLDSHAAVVGSGWRFSFGRRRAIYGGSREAALLGRHGSGFRHAARSVGRVRRAASALTALVVLAAGLSACEPLPKPVVAFYGDSLMAESQIPLTFQLGNRYQTTMGFLGGTALCDWAERIESDASSLRPELVVLEFSGNAVTPCMWPDGHAPSDAEAVATYRESAQQVVDRLRSLGIPVVFVGSPPRADSPPLEETVDSAYRDIARSSGGWASYLNAGSALSGPDGAWTATLPCLSFEGPAEGCVDGQIPVRSPDKGHLCPSGVTVSAGEGARECSVWSSGAWRYAARITSYLPAALDGRPIGALDQVRAVPGGVHVSGFAYDPQAAIEPTEVHVYVDATGYALTADGPRSDLAERFPYMDPGHAFNDVVPASPGTHQVCAYAIRVGPGDHTGLGCHTVVVPSGSPTGYLDVATGGPASVSVAGWAADPDTRDPIDVHIYVDDHGVAVRADRDRPDVGVVFPDWGPTHGFTAVIPTSPGRHTVCAYGIDVGPGENALLGCRDVTTAPPPPTTTTSTTTSSTTTTTSSTTTTTTNTSVLAPEPSPPTD
jgi:hypothetical protein